LYREEAVAALMKGVTQYAIRQLKAHVAPPSPKHIILAYVPSTGEEQLLAEFDFFVFPLRLSRLAEYDAYGRQHRHNRKLAVDYVISSVDAAGRQFMDVKRRLSSISDKEPLFLPPQNFKVSATERIAGLFRRMSRQVAPWTERINRNRVVQATSEDLPRNIPRGARKMVLSDVRGLLFPHDRRQDGPVRELEEGSSHDERKLFMRASFRFGVPLENGYHHDVQYPGRGLTGQTFDCCREGSIALTCSHANIYPNDYVRPSEI
jgi:hypothetical protein